jgi:hypothetical protein
VSVAVAIKEGDIGEVVHPKATKHSKKRLVSYSFAGTGGRYCYKSWNYERLQAHLRGSRQITVWRKGGYDFEALMRKVLGLKRAIDQVSWCTDGNLVQGAGTSHTLTISDAVLVINYQHRSILNHWHLSFMGEVPKIALRFPGIGPAFNILQGYGSDAVLFEAACPQLTSSPCPRYMCNPTSCANIACSFKCTFNTIPSPSLAP